MILRMISNNSAWHRNFVTMFTAELIIKIMSKTPPRAVMYLSTVISSPNYSKHNQPYCIIPLHCTYICTK